MGTMGATAAAAAAVEGTGAKVAPQAESLSRSRCNRCPGRRCCIRSRPLRRRTRHRSRLCRSRCTLQSLDLPQAWKADQWGDGGLQTTPTRLHSSSAASRPPSGPCQPWRRRGAFAGATHSASRRCSLGVRDARGTCPSWSRCTKRGRPQQGQWRRPCARPEHGTGPGTSGVAVCSGQWEVRRLTESASSSKHWPGRRARASSWRRSAPAR